MALTINGKRGHGFERSERGIWECLQRIKGRGNCNHNHRKKKSNIINELLVN